MLALQEATAKAALAQSARAAARGLLRVADPRAWTEEHPWKSAGVAAAAGFVIATRIGTGEAEASSPPQAGPSPDREAASGTGTQVWDLLTSLLLSSGTDALKGVLTPWLAQKVQSALQRRGLGAEAESTPPAPEPPA